MPKGHLHLGRVSEVVKALTKEELGYYVEAFRLKTHLPLLHRYRKTSKKGAPHPERVCKVLEQLGGSFVKLGQLLSLRPDLVPATYCQAFERLQDEVSPIPFSEIKKIVQNELGKPMSRIFKHVEKEPIGSASIAQVHRAELLNGTEVVIKVQRPGIKEIMSEDIETMYFLAHKLEEHLREASVSPVEIVKEFHKYTQEELDFTIEGNHLDSFQEFLEGKKHIIVPKYYRDYSTDKVLVMDYLPGRKLSDLLRRKVRFNRNDVARMLFDFSIQQFFQKDIFHADLHPGNVLVMKGNKLGLLDFGITGSLSQEIQEQGIRLYIAMLDRDVKEVYNALLAVGQEQNKFKENALKHDIEEILHDWHGKTLKQNRITHTLHLLFNACRRNGLRLPPDMIMLARGLVIVEGTCLKLNPRFNIVAESHPYIIRLLKNDLKKKISLKKLLHKSYTFKDYMRNIPPHAMSALKTIEKGTFKIDIADHDVFNIGSTLDKAGDRIALAFIGSGLVVAGAMLTQTPIGPRLWDVPALALISFVFGMAITLLLAWSYVHKYNLPKHLRR